MSNYLILGVLGFLLILVIFIYNSFISLVNATKNAWSDIEVLLKRRADLIPNLIEIVKGYAKHEKQVFENVTKARTAALSATSVKEKGAAENQLSSAIKSLFAVAEDYPNLRASENFKDLQSQLTETENNIAQSRRFYNANVRDLNTKIEIFPYNLFAKLFGFQKWEFFQATESEKQDIKANLS